MNIIDIKTGDSFLIRGTSKISDLIYKIMKHWGKKKGLNTDLIYTHAARFIWINNDLYIFGSIGNGYEPLLFTDKYNWNTTDFAVMRRKIPLTIEEQNKTTEYVLHLDSISIGYQYWNFFQWLFLIYLGVDFFGKGSDKFNYCYESERKARKNLNPENYGNVTETSIFDLLYDKNYDIIYRSKQ